jgi:hypothetical protein
MPAALLRPGDHLTRTPGAASASPGLPALSTSAPGKRFGDRIAFHDASLEIGYGSATVAGIPLTPGNAVEIRRRISIMPESDGQEVRRTAPPADVTGSR